MEGAEYHAISYEDVSRYGDTPMAELAVIDAVTMWNDANESVNFIIVESYSDSDVNITWERRLHDNILGLHRAPLNDDGRQDARSIRVRIGIDDCNYDYQLFSHDTPKHTVMHEMGRYLGLRHTDDKNRLMHSYERPYRDAAQVYDDLNLNIPYVDKPEIQTSAGRDVQLRIDKIDEEVRQVVLQRQELKNTYDDDNADYRQAFDESVAQHHALVRQVQELQDRIACMQM